MYMRYACLLLLLLLPALAAAHTYVDSVFADAELDGDMAFTADGYPLSWNTTTYEMLVGDTGSGASVPSNSVTRAYVSFSLPQLPEGYEIINSTIRLYQNRSVGNGGYGYPNWSIAGGDTIDCIISHINYGEELNFEDWEKGDTGNSNTYNNNVGVITAEGMSEPGYHGERGYRYLDITDCVLLDYTLNNIHTQYRIAFEIDTDYDDDDDYIGFSTADASYPDERSPKLYFTYWDGVSITDEEMTEFTSFHIFPNPVTTEATLQFQLNRPHTIGIDVYDIRGRKCMESSAITLSQGEHQIPLDFSNQANGVYFIRLNCGSRFSIHKLLHIK